MLASDFGIYVEESKYRMGESIKKSGKTAFSPKIDLGAYSGLTESLISERISLVYKEYK